MSYQALLFCPDEKTARTITQILGDLDFNVTACTEPFAAVKKFMGERFDAVVVDCDNEQNATLLFKSARSAPNNQGALAVAVVEGQAGVAKAFRIGANLVLTKPINVEQAKGTLRVARGLLRKNEGTKPASVGTTAFRPPAQASVPAKPIPPSPIPSPADTRMPAQSPTAVPVMTTPAPVMPIQKPVVQPSIAASAASEIGEQGAEAGISGKSTAADLDVSSESTTAAGAGPAGVKMATAVIPQASARISSSFSASAPAPARVPMEGAAVESAKTSAAPSQDSKIDSKELIASPDKGSASAPTLTFGGKVGGGQETATRGSKTKLIAAVAALVIVASGYAAWMKWNPANAPANPPAKISTQPRPAAVPIASTRDAENTSSGAQTQTTETQESDTQASQKTVTPKSDKAAKAETHPAKASAASEASKPETSIVAENTMPASIAAAQPMVIKNGSGKAAVRTTANTESTDAPALSMTEAAAQGQELPNLGPATTATPVLQQMVVSQGVSRGLLVKQVQPVYPQTAIEMHVEGAVELMAIIAKTGNISSVKVLSGDKELARAAIDAVKQWKYKPYLLNGEPVDIQTQITVRFKLPE
jgi:TonB family protein